MYDVSKIHLSQCATQAQELQNYCYTKYDMKLQLHEKPLVVYLNREVNMVEALGRNLEIILFAVLLLITGVFPYFYLFIFFC